MRPLELSVTGLRSYRTTRTITFPDDWQLAAVVGPTGAGKSSLLEALVYALFGSGTVPGASQPTNLITDDAREMRVTLRFGVGPDEYEIVRTYRPRGANVPPVLKSASRMTTGAGEVADEIKRILGLQQDAFCSTVLLPQGQFATLLQAAGTVQKATLDAFFRLAEVTEVSERLVSAASGLASRRREVEAVREQLPADPATGVALAQERMARATGQRDAADRLVNLVARHETEAADSEARAATARRRAGELVRAAGDLDRVAERARTFLALAIELTSAGRAMGDRRRRASEALREAREALRRLDAPSVEATAAHVDALLRRVDEAHTARTSLETAGAAAEHARVAAERARADHDRLDAERTAADARYDEAVAARTEANDRFIGVRELAAEADRCVKAAAAAALHHSTSARAFESARADEESARKDLDLAGTELAAAEIEAARTAAELADAETDHAAAAGRADELRRLHDSVDERRTELDRSVEALAAGRAVQDEARVVLDQATQATSEADARWRRAEAALLEARREDAIAVVALGCHPGVPCPVCSRALPQDFVPPAHSAATREAEVAEREARDERDRCQGETARARATLDTRSGGVAEVAARVDEARAALTEADRLLAVAGGGEAGSALRAAEAARDRLARGQRDERIASQRVASARADLMAREQAIATLAAARQRAATALDSATRARDDATAASETARSYLAGAGGPSALATAESELGRATTTVSERKAAADATRHAASVTERRLAAADRDASGAAATAESVSSQYRRADGAVVSALASLPPDARGTAVTSPMADVSEWAKVAAVATEWVHTRRALITAAQEHEQAAEAEVEQADHAARALDDRRIVELERPLSEARSASTQLGVVADVAPATADIDPAGLAAWAVAAAVAARDRASAQTTEAEAADADVAGARSAARAACEAAEIARERLNAWSAEIHSELGAAGEALRRAAEVAERARTLDAALAASATRARLLGLARDLCQGRDSFANHVLVARRQGLIAEAAAILSELSSGRLAFAEDVGATFSVLDTATGSVRDPRLLSGGEQFQASLALALGLVEIAARAGSRIECLFLDEGFGALDPASLDTALDALESAARRGRRIVAVTHVDAVTARADQVLGVSSSDSGSRPIWRDAGLEPPS